jgi:parallel beta-helix repeat protein
VQKTALFILIIFCFIASACAQKDTNTFAFSPTLTPQASAGIPTLTHQTSAGSPTLTHQASASSPTLTPQASAGSPTLTPQASAGKLYYISTSGDDANPGTEAQPYRTIGKAASVATMGETVLIHAGEYYEDVKPLNSGAPGKYITYKNYGDGEVIIDAQNGTRAGCIEINNKSYLQFFGLTVRGANGEEDWPRAGISVTDGSSNIVLSNITAYGNYFGVMAVGESTPVSFVTVSESKTFNSVTLIGNTHYGIFFYKKVYDSSIINNHVAYSLPESQSYGIEVGTNYPGVQSNGAQRIVITGNKVDHNESQGIHTWNAVGVLISDNYAHDNGATGIQIENGSENIVIENNLSENNAQSYEYETGAWIDDSRNVVVRNNVFRSNKIGLNITSSDRVIVHDNYIYLNNRGAENINNASGLIVNDNVSNAYITHNTFYKNSISEAGKAGVNFKSSCTRVVFKNNIISETASANDLLQDSCIIVSDYNDFFNTRTLAISWNGSSINWSSYLSTSGQDVHSLTQDPLFVNPATFDFNLQPSSPLIGKGVILAETTGAGSGNTVTVTDANYFSDGFGVGKGDDIMIAGNRVKIIAIDYTNNAITIDQEISWTSGDAVSFSFSGVAPDIGVNEAISISALR